MNTIPRSLNVFVPSLAAITYTYGPLARSRLGASVVPSQWIASAFADSCSQTGRPATSQTFTDRAVGVPEPTNPNEHPIVTTLSRA